jgi:hypothetical protein
MIYNSIVRHSIRKLFLGFAILVGTSTGANALMISTTGGTSNGNPGGQPLYEVSGLVQGDAFDLSWGGVSGLDVTATVIIDLLTSTNADVRVILDNLSTPISGNDPRVVSFGVLVEDFAGIANTATGGLYLDLADSSNFPGFNGIIDVCGTSGGNCGGGGSGGVPAGGSDDFTLHVSGNFASTLTLANFGLKIQGGPEGGSYELAGVPMPEPSAIGLLLLGMAGLGARRNPLSNR